MKRLLATLAAVVMVCGSAAASGSIECAAGEDDVSVEMTVGSLPVLAVVGATIRVGGDSWSLAGEGENRIAVGQAFGDDARMLVDFTDANVERVVASLRLFLAEEGKDVASGGTLVVAERGAWAVSCIGP